MHDQQVRPHPGNAGGLHGSVLCVDDEPQVLEAIKRSLRRCGVEVLTADCGAAALQIMRTHSPGVVISDMRMPQMDGTELLEKVRRDWPDASRVILTGYANADATTAAINRAQVHSYLTKPWDDAALQAAVGTWLADARERRDTRAQAAQSGHAQRQASERADEVRRLEHRLHDERRQHFLGHVNALVNLQRLRNHALAEHGRRVATIAVALARRLGLSSDEVMAVHAAGLLHDIGLIGMPTTVLLHGGVLLTDHEQDIVDRHAQLSLAVLKPIVEMHDVGDIVESHHARWDGKDRLNGLAGNAIPIAARILAVADAVDENEHGWMGTAALGERDLLAWLRHGAGTQFDERVLETYLRDVHRARRA